MQTLLEILNKTTEYFQKCGVPEPRLDAQYIMAHGLQMSRMDLYLNFDRPMSDQELVKLRPMVKRRSNREPLQHILGSTSFRGHEILCDSRALIPRPETEILVEQTLRLMEKVESPYILDIGTGTGAIAIAIAIARTDAQVLALDLSPAALELAKENVEKHELQQRVLLRQSNLCQSLDSERFHCIVSNPPYIPSDELSALQEEVRRFDPSMALDGGPDGLLLVRNLVEQSTRFLHHGGHLLLEVGEGQSLVLALEYANPRKGIQYKTCYADLEGVFRFPHFQFVGDL